MVTTRRLRPAIMLVMAGMLLLAACGGGTTLPAQSYTPSPGALPNFSHIFVIVMENSEYGDIIGSSNAPYINSLAHTYGLATQDYAVTHPSLPNYLALAGGDTFGVTTDCNDCFVNAPNLVDALDAGHKTWRAYMESMPTPCFTGDAYPYMQKHDPFIYFDDIRNTPARCNNIVPLTGLASDLSAGAVPDFAWITPNMCHDMHDCSTATGDAWLAHEVPLILASTAWKQGGALFITWDEGTSSNGCCAYANGGHIATLVISPLGKPRFQSATPHDHYSLLRTVTDAWNLTEPGHAADPASAPYTEFFTAG
ncbi:MAG: alkaline phosphatase family protein [Ktedonobacterales bacterium]